MIRSISFFIVVSLMVTNSVSSAAFDLASDTWVATDGLGRQLPGHDICGGVRDGRFTGIFYWTWHTMHGRQGPFDNTKIIAADPQDPKWGPLGAPHHWGEPELGYYIMTDPYVIRKHASMLTDAGIDVIIFDTTNPPFTFKESYMALCREYAKIRSEGNEVPQIAFLCPFGDPTVVVNAVYNDLYKQGLYKDLWFNWKGKPLIMADPYYFKDSEIVKFFTFRKPIPSYFTGPTGPDQWGWLEVYPQHGFYNREGKVEQVTVGVAQNAVGNELSAMSHKEGAMGRSWHGGARDTGKDAVLYGLNFAEQWEKALEYDPEFIFITGWNEWVAGHFNKWYKYDGDDSYYKDALFVDQYNHEYSRDTEPMKGGHGDNYYYQMVSYIRKYKGVRRLDSAAGACSISIDGEFGDWDAVRPEYRDTVGDTAWRDHKGYGKTHYVNKTGRNDIVLSRAGFDREMLYFYVETRDDITSHTDRNWMLLFIDSDRDHSTGWNGYDFLVNYKVVDSDTTVVMESTGGWDWKEVGRAGYRVKGNRMELSIPVETAGIDLSGEFGFDFHWADNIQKDDDITEFSVSGDSAPNRRFNYRFAGKF